MDGDRLIAKILKLEGVEWIACFPHQSLIDAVAKEGIRPIICRQERAGVNMADGFSRINAGRKIGVFSMQKGPGAENAFGGVAQAYADSVPMLLLPGGSERSVAASVSSRASMPSITTKASRSGPATSTWSSVSLR
jgi:acetolactate synthase-1/2/3 large subunit